MAYDPQEHRLEMEENARYLKSLAHPLRLCILEKLLKDKSVAAADLYACMEAPQPVISKHLLYLKNKGVLTSVARGDTKYYSICDPKTEKLLKALKGE